MITELCQILQSNSALPVRHVDTFLRVGDCHRGHIGVFLTQFLSKLHRMYEGNPA